LSVLIRYLELFEQKVELPEDSYHGLEIVDIAKKLKEQYKDRFLKLSYDNQKITGDTKESKIIRDYAKNYLLDIIKNTLLSFGVKMDI
jgi:arginyl-tRNA synthetase